jgi:hypothetical protein
MRGVKSSGARCFFGSFGQWSRCWGGATHCHPLPPLSPAADAHSQRSPPAPPLGEAALNKGAGQSWGRSQPFRGRPGPAELRVLLSSEIGRSPAFSFWTASVQKATFISISITISISISTSISISISISTTIPISISKPVIVVPESS